MHTEIQTADFDVQDCKTIEPELGLIEQYRLNSKATAYEVAGNWPLLAEIHGISTEVNTEAQEFNL